MTQQCISWGAMIKEHVSTHSGVLKGQKGEAGQADLQTKSIHFASTEARHDGHCWVSSLQGAQTTPHTHTHTLKLSRKTPYLSLSEDMRPQTFPLPATWDPTFLSCSLSREVNFLFNF